MFLFLIEECWSCLQSEKTLTELYVLLNYWGVVLCTLNPSVSLLREVTVSLKPILYHICL